MKSIYRANLFILVIVTFQVFLGGAFARELVGLFGFVNTMILHEFIVLLLPALIYIKLTKQSTKEVFRVNKLPVIDAVLVIIIAFLAQPVASFLSQVTGLFFQNPVAQAFEILKLIPYPTMMLMMAITPAICEEAVTRGVVLHGYNKTSILKAALINGLVFSILHLDPQQSLYTFVLGVLFAYLVRITNSIWASVLCHFTFNGIQVTLTQLIKNSANTEAVKAAAEESLSKMQTVIMLGTTFFLAAICTAAIIGILIFMNNRNRRVNSTVINGYIELEERVNDNRYDLNNERALLYSNGENEERRVFSYMPLILLVLLYFVYLVLI